MIATIINHTIDYFVRSCALFGLSIALYKLIIFEDALTYLHTSMILVVAQLHSLSVASI
jgi:hypothetical protein